jgi:hypothetical protein
LAINTDFAFETSTDTPITGYSCFLRWRTFIHIKSASTSMYHLRGEEGGGGGGYRLCEDEPVAVRVVDVAVGAAAAWVVKAVGVVEVRSME